MKRTIGIGLGVLAVVAPALAIIPTTRDEIHWRWAAHRDRAAGYRSYVETWPDGRHAREAQRRHDERGWANAQAVNTVEEYEQYLRFHSEGRHAAEARDHIDALHWQEATTNNTVEGFERYLQLHPEGKHVATAGDNIDSLRWHEATTAHTIRSYQDYCGALPQGQHVQEARSRAAALKTDRAPVAAAMKIGTVASFQQFLEDFPGHQEEGRVRQAIRDLSEERDLVSLFEEEKIDVVVRGDDIQEITVRMCKLVPYPLALRIPVGTFFVAVDSSVQNMVTTAESKVRLTSDEWQSVSVAVACANRARKVPRAGDCFMVRRSPPEWQLAQLMPVLAQANVSADVRQAAVWIVTDDADYEDLGILTTSPFGFPARAISASDTARAMKICDEAGINIRYKAIWNDRDEIISELQSTESNYPESKPLRQWLEQR
ncbi:MAG TPA: hypothetical protein PLU87_06385 [Sedimentisphaerales bacterium]|nr:hypothetical protein [Sedimentisphaerales bacterium]HRS10479.1 hypothetical protein [Sedimentisphaerales bacterium]HRV47297.1 hypothetical protein [Sedimentisphaerales bacterium]